MVGCEGLRVAKETNHINSVEMITIGTTGMNPKTAMTPSNGPQPNPGVMVGSG